MSWSTVAWHHTGGTISSKEQEIPYWERWSKTHLVGYDEDEMRHPDYASELVTLCGLIPPRAHYTYQKPIGYRPGRVHPECGNCRRIARRRGLNLEEIYAGMETADR